MKPMVKIKQTYFQQTNLSNIAETIKKAEEIFYKNVLSVKKLMKEIGDIKKIVHKEQKIFSCMTIVILLIKQFLQN